MEVYFFGTLSYNIEISCQNIEKGSHHIEIVCQNIEIIEKISNYKILL